MQGMENPDTFERSFVDVCIILYRHMTTFCGDLKNASVIFEGVLTNRDFWIACVGSQEAADWILKIRSNKQFIKEFINSLFAQDFLAVISTISQLFAQLEPQLQAVQKDVWKCASLTIVLENCARAGDLIGVVACCCSVTDIATQNAENASKLLSKVILSLGIDDEDDTNRIPFLVDALFEVAITLNSKASRNPAFAMSFAREFCEQIALACSQVLAPLLQGMDGVEKQIENCARRLKVAATSDSVSNMEDIAEKWAKAHRSQIFEAIAAPLPQLNEYLWTSEAFAQAWIGLKILSLLCDDSTADSEIVSVIWVYVQLLIAGPSMTSSCPELNRIFLRCSGGSRNFNFAAAGSKAIPVPDIFIKSAESCRKLCQTFSSECGVMERAQGIAEFINNIVSNPTLLTTMSSFLHLRSIKQLLVGSYGSILKFFQCIGHVNILRLSLLLETKQFMECIFLVKHFQSSCLNLKGHDEADVAFIVDFCVAGLIAYASKSIQSVSSPLGAQLMFAGCSCSTINRSVPLKDYSKVLHAAITAKDLSESDMELAVSMLNSVYECFGKSFSVDVESHAASLLQFLKRCAEFFSDRDRSAPGQNFAPHVLKLIALISPVLDQNPKLLGWFNFPSP
jgi:hypothetical protein